MSRTTPGPLEAGYVYHPTMAVTAFFSTGQGGQAILDALSEAGFACEKVELFSGGPGIERLDLAGERHGAWVRFRRGLESVLADEAGVYQRAEQVLRSGGSVVAVFTDGGEGQK